MSRMELDLTSIETIVGIIGGSATAAVTIIGWVVAPIRRRWNSVKSAFDEERARIKSDHERDMAYMERRDRDHQAAIASLKDDLKDTRDRLERCEAWRRNPPGFQV